VTFNPKALVGCSNYHLQGAGHIVAAALGHTVICSSSWNSWRVRRWLQVWRRCWRWASISWLWPRNCRPPQRRFRC